MYIKLQFKIVFHNLFLCDFSLIIGENRFFLLKTNSFICKSKIVLEKQLCITINV